MMKLLYTPNSPFARKCRIVVQEKKLESRVELVHVGHPLENPQELLDINPLGTVPALVTDEGLHLCDSAAICEYLDSLPSDIAPLLPPTESRECVLAFMALAEGMMNAAVSCTLERFRPQANINISINPCGTLIHESPAANSTNGIEMLWQHPDGSISKKIP